MKLALVLLLLFPACYCSSVTTVCDHARKYLSAGMFLPEEKFQKLLESHKENKAGMAGTIKMRDCVQQFTDKDRNDYFRYLAILLGGCPHDSAVSSH